MRPRLAALALTLPLGLVTLTGCSGGDADTATSPSKSARGGGDEGTELGVVAGDEISPEEFTALMVAAFDKATTATMTMELTAGGQEIDVTGEADYTTDPMAMRMDMTGMGGVGDMTMVMIDDTLYIKLLARSEKYIKVDLDDPSNPMGGSFTGQLDPRAQAEVIQNGLQTATYLGEEEVDGETFDHYSAIVASGALLEEMEIDPASADALPEEITYDLWLDADGFHRQMSVDMGAVAGEVLIRFDDWGSDVDIVAPPSDEVTDMAGMTGMG